MKSRKIITSSIIALTLLGSSAPILAGASTLQTNVKQAQNTDSLQESQVLDAQVQDNLEYSVFNDSLITNITPETEVNLTPEASNAIEGISELFKIDSNGNTVFTGTVNDLISLGFSESDAKIAVEEASLLVSEDSNYRGFVGLHINFGPRVKKMNGWAAGTFVGGYVAFQLKAFMTTPVTAGVVAVISGGIVAAVKAAIDKHYNRISIGVYIPHYSKAFNVRTP